MADFNPRSPHGERPTDSHDQALFPAISIHAPRTGSDRRRRKSQKWTSISIHAPRTGSDLTSDAIMGNTENFNPRSPHGERPAAYTLAVDFGDFNPRSPHGERPADDMECLLQYDFNPRSPHGERPAQDRVNEQVQDISIHAPRTGSDDG